MVRPEGLEPPIPVNKSHLRSYEAALIYTTKHNKSNTTYFLFSRSIGPEIKAENIQ